MREEQIAPEGAAGDGGAGSVPPEVTEVRIGGLREHPRHREIDTQLSDAEIDLLAEDIRANGQQTPIEVTPDGVIVCGHQRVRALKKLGREVAAARVRHDLAGAGAAAVEERMINDNLLSTAFRKSFGSGLGGKWGWSYG